MFLPFINLFLIYTHEMPRKTAFFQEGFNWFKFQTMERFEIYKNYIFAYIFQSKPYLDTIKLKKVKSNCILVK